MSSLILQGYTRGNPITQGFYVGASLFVSAIVVEDGSAPAGANSYVTLAEVRAYAKARGKAALFTDYAKAEAAVILAADYLESLLNFAGSRTFVEQYMQWPRAGVYLNGVSFKDNAIPANLKKAQMELAIVIASGIELRPLNQGKFAIQKTVGPITTKYSEKVGFGAPDLSYIEDLLASLFGIFNHSLRTYRV